MKRIAACRLGAAALLLAFLVGISSAAAGWPLPEDAEKALALAGTNRPQLEAAVTRVPLAQREGVLFLIANMPQDDLASLSADFLVANVTNAYAVMDEVPWGHSVPSEVFLNNILPYAVVNERRDAWRADFRARFLPVVRDCTTPAQAAARLNQKVFGTFGVYYSPERLKPDQSPYESIEYKKASCTGLSILLIAACRSVGVPARFAGTPLWADGSGNHSWVEVWSSDGWHFTGAAEPSGDALDQSWFIRRASEARRDDPQQAIYAASFRRTPLHFPMVWAPSNRLVSAVNVTDRYTRGSTPAPDGTRLVSFTVLAKVGGSRVAARVRVTEASSAAPAFEGDSKDDRFDLNDTLEAYLPSNGTYRVEARYGEQRAEALLPPGAAPQKIVLAF
jgi:hypothetical protein